MHQTPESIVSAWLETDAGPTELVEAIRSYGDACAVQEKKRCLSLIEQRRVQVLQSPSDPTWTEHFAELATAIRATASPLRSLPAPDTPP